MHEIREILLKITFDLNHLGGKVKFWGAVAPPGYVPDQYHSISQYNNYAKKLIILAVW